ncbi:hypothetical protein A4X13_0g7526 [Tilletia indica]|uniref:Uncharacterized protein n=1 Tax=Tilletia indica TaxID=43049 RepID=A0A8T8SJM6_9BASI|nr:hypothetical protein A4X13_0g7526 [Tilletia indica]
MNQCLQKQARPDYRKLGRRARKTTKYDSDNKLLWDQWLGSWGYRHTFLTRLSEGPIINDQPFRTGSLDILEEHRRQDDSERLG